MADSLFKIIWQLGIFLIVAQTIQHFRPNESYEKYIRILSNIMVLAMFVVPLFSLFKKDISGQFQAQIMLYEQQLETINVGIGYREEDRDKVLLANLEKEVKSRLKGIAADEGLAVTGVRITGAEPDEKGNFSLDGLRILVLLEAALEQKEEIKVEPVLIGEEQDGEEKDRREVLLSKEFAGKLGTPEEYMEVRIND